MNILILSAQSAQAIIDKQDGQHRLAPVPLTDGRCFLSADALTEPRFAAHLEDMDYDTATLDDVRDLLPQPEEGEI